MLRGQLRQLVRGIEVTSTELRWYDEVVHVRNAGMDSAGPGEGRRANQTLIDFLANLFYNHFYTTARPTLRLEVAMFSQSNPSANLTPGLMAANTGSGRWDQDWHCVEVSAQGKSVVVQKDGLSLLATTEQVRTADGALPVAGDCVLVRTPSGALTRAPGFYVAHSNHPLDYKRPLSRLYLNVTSSGAPALLRHVCDTLNGRELPFDFKVANDAAHYFRCDVAVLYTPRDRIVEAFNALRDTLIRRSSIRLLVPPFVCQLLPGVGAADDPANGESFGSDRCRRLAAAIVAINDPLDEEERLTRVVELMANSGIDPERPYLASPGATDIYRALA